MKKPVIVFDRVAKKYRHPGSQQALSTTLKSYLLHDLWTRRSRGKTNAERLPESAIWALRDVSLQVQQGSTLGIIGHNGSGKSTLLKIMSHILKPDSGCATINGTVAALIELGAGFHPELTGKENILINGVILGLSKSEIRDRMDSIIAFADIGPFIDYPVRTYSSGMYARLGFAVAIHVEPDILLIDEILSVGDAEFTRKCHDALNLVKKNNKSIVLVSHNLTTIRDWCDDAVWLDGGMVKLQGDAKDVVAAYTTAVGAA